MFNLKAKIDLLACNKVILKQYYSMTNINNFIIDKKYN